MTFKYLVETMTREEARKAYRDLAKKIHPDMGGDEEEFKILANEYAYLEKRESEPEIASVDDLFKAAGAKVQLIVNTLKELYPRTSVVLYYSPVSIEAEFNGNVSMSRMLAVEQVIQSFNYSFAVTMAFKRDVRKSWITFQTKGDTTWINTSSDDPLVAVKPEPVYKGHRYIIQRGSRYERCLDKKSGRIYVMRRIPKLTLQELLGVGK